jgi:hypothetical protein
MANEEQNPMNSEIVDNNEEIERDRLEDDDYFETLDIDKLEIKNRIDPNQSPADLETTQNENETKFDYNRYTTSINDTISNYDQNEIDLKDFTNNEDTSNDNPAINKFIEEAIDFGANALDLSKKNLLTIPKILFKLDILQVWAYT